MTININGTTGISGVDGSAGTPAIQGSDTNTGINFGTNEVSVSTDGSTRLTIDSSGRLLQNLTSAPGFIGGVSHQIIQGEGTLNSNGTLALLRNAVPTAGQGVGQIFMGDNGGQRGVVIQGQAVSNWGTGDCPTDLVISTSADASATPTERVHIKSTGEVRIGLDNNAASTAGDDLVIQGTSDRGLSIVSGTSSSSNIFFGDSDDTDVGRIAYQHNDNALDFSTNASGTDIRIDSSGRLLINGTTSQTWSGGAPLLQVSGTNAAGTMHLGAFQYSDSSDGGELVLGSSRGTTVGANTIVQNGDTLGRIRFCGADGVDFTNRGGEITCAVDGTPGSDDLPTRMMFFTASDGAGSPTERMRIQSSGTTQFQNTSQFFCNPDNSSTLGRSANRWSAVWASNGTIQTSDERLKTEVTDSTLATDFIKALRPVSYKWIEGGKRHTGEYDEDSNWVYESVPGQRTHWGFIAQEVKQVADDAGVDFGGWVLGDKDDPESTQSLRYDQFIAPLTKALQEAISKIETLEARLSVLEGGAN